MNSYAIDLKAAGYEVTSRWISQHQAVDLHASNAKYNEIDRLTFAMHDYEDVMRADRLIAFTEDPHESTAANGRRGGRHVELGLALAAAKHVYVVGYRENVFCHLPQIIFYKTFNELLENLR